MTKKKYSDSEILNFLLIFNFLIIFLYFLSNDICISTIELIQSFVLQMIRFQLIDKLDISVQIKIHDLRY